MLFAVAYPEDVVALLLVDVAVAHPGRGTRAVSSATSSSNATRVGALALISGGTVARAESYLRW